MKTGIQLLILFLLLGLNCYSQQKPDPEYTGVEYIQLKSELVRGWNTWNTKSVLSHVLLPEAISVDFHLKDKNSEKILKEALMGRRGKGAESIVGNEGLVFNTVHNIQATGLIENVCNSKSNY